MEIFDSLKQLHGLGQTEREYLYYAAVLHDIGLTLSHSQHHIHSYYLIRNAELVGFTENEKEIIANTGRYHRKSHPKLKHQGYFNLSFKDRQTVKKLAAMLRIADGLDRMHSSLIHSVTARRGRKNVVFGLAHKRGVDLGGDLWGAEIKKYLFEEVFGVKVEFSSFPSGPK
jgi:exopolyphosphatase/guanosine-5'-triphosphate,3'-diphosphate pyrophosphatase